MYLFICISLFIFGITCTVTRTMQWKMCIKKVIRLKYPPLHFRHVQIKTWVGEWRRLSACSVSFWRVANKPSLTAPSPTGHCSPWLIEMRKHWQNSFTVLERCVPIRITQTVTTTQTLLWMHTHTRRNAGRTAPAWCTDCFLNREPVWGIYVDAETRFEID